MAEGSEQASALLQLEQKKQAKSRAKAVFTRVRHKLFNLLDEDEAQSKDRIRLECERLEAASVKIMDDLFELSALYAACGDPVGVQQLTPEVEKVEMELKEARISNCRCE